MLQHLAPVLPVEYTGSGCTLPRQQWPTYSGAVVGVRHLQNMGYPTVQQPVVCKPTPHVLQRAPPIPAPREEQPPIPLQTICSEEEPTAETPLMVKKRESSV